MSWRDTGTGAFRPSARLAVLALLLLTRCGGSGSSGFDAISEAAAVERALDRGECVTFNGTTYCGSEAPLDLDDATVNVRIDVAKTPRSCNPRPVTGCAPLVPFAPDGFPEGTAFRAAAAVTAEGPWTLVPAGPGDGTDPLVITLPEPPVEFTLVAVLGYTRPVPDDLPSEAARLADFRADAVYLRAPFEEPATP
jgi:hypothetical protein